MVNNEKLIQEILKRSYTGIQEMNMNRELEIDEEEVVQPGKGKDILEEIQDNMDEEEKNTCYGENL